MALFSSDHNTLLLIPVTLIVINVLRRIFEYVKDIRRLPPGPTGLPVLGYLPFMGRHPYLKLMELSKTYGPMFSLRMGPSNVVVINGWQHVKEALSKDELLGRPVPHLTSAIGLPPSLNDGSGDLWKEQRRFALHHLRDHGFGKTTMEEKIREEIGCLLQVISKHAKKGSVDIHQLITPSVSNNICILVFGKRYDYDDPERRMLDEAIHTVPRLFRTTGVQVVFPALAKFLFRINFAWFGELKYHFQNIGDFAEKHVQNHLETLDIDRPRDYIDSFLIEQLQRKESGDVGYFTRDMVVNNARGFFGAGSETVRTTTDWAMLLMAKHQDIQRRIHQEIDEIIGRDHQVAWADRLKLPFTQAVAYEVQRWASVVAMNLPRRAVVDVIVGGIKIPKDTVVFLNFWSVNRDPKVWDRPDEFWPQHFYDEDTKSLKKPEAFIPFSYGKRNCIGQSLAEVEVFLYFASILQRFKIEPRKGHDLNFEREMGITLSPVMKPMLDFIERN